MRDFVLGAVLLGSDGELLHFGGKVIKNVAGFDLARLLCGSLGILGPIVEVSLKVMPVPSAQHTLCFEMGMNDALPSSIAGAAGAAHRHVRHGSMAKHGCGYRVPLPPYGALGSSWGGRAWNRSSRGVLEQLARITPIPGLSDAPACGVFRCPCTADPLPLSGRS